MGETANSTEGIWWILEGPSFLSNIEVGHFVLKLAD